MKTNPIKILSLFPAAAFAFSLTACDVDKTDEGEMPEVEVTGETNLPEYEIKKTEEGEMPEVDVKGEADLPNYDVEGPDVEVEKKKVEVPTLDVDLPEEEDNSSGNPTTEPDASGADE